MFMVDKRFTRIMSNQLHHTNTTLSVVHEEEDLTGGNQILGNKFIIKTYLLLLLLMNTKTPDICKMSKNTVTD